MLNKKKSLIIGGGAAGFFSAIACAQVNPQHQVILIEKNRQMLSKVRISGGGRCNVTHACFDPVQLVQYYPRGSKALLGPFHRFQPKDTIEWFKNRGVELKIEEDGRMFPITNSSETIIDCLIKEARSSNVEIIPELTVENLEKHSDHFRVTATRGTTFDVNNVLVATGSSKTYHWVEQFGHSIIPPVPSLFTFNVPSSPLSDLSGIAVEDALLKIEGTPLEQRGPLLITHWGFSGPAVLKLSAWGARQLHDKGYRATLTINWLPNLKMEHLVAMRQKLLGRFLHTESAFHLPKQLWKRLLLIAGLKEEKRWNEISNRQIEELAQVLQVSSFEIEGKTTFKQEFVTCGGVNLDEVNFKTMESRLCSGLYFAGEILDIDGITGGFNFQNAWTTGWIAGHAMASQ